MENNDTPICNECGADTRIMHHDEACQFYVSENSDAMPLHLVGALTDEDKYDAEPTDANTEIFNKAMGKPTEATTMDEATAPCVDCNVSFPTPHKNGCPQLEGQAAMQQEMAKEEAKGEVQMLTPRQALMHVKAHLTKVENMLNPALLVHWGSESIHTMLDDLLKVAGMSKDEQKEFLDKEKEAADENS